MIDAMKETCDNCEYKGNECYSDVICGKFKPIKDSEDKSSSVTTDTAAQLDAIK